MYRKLLCIWLVLLTIAPLVGAQGALAAFPGAEGFGAVATGGRGGVVIYVTTLAAQGPGSLAEALATPGARTIVFAVSGVIDAPANIIYGDVTIAGQTSPGGIIVRGLVCDGHYDANDCDNLIIRHVRSRPAGHLDGSTTALDDALRLDGVENVMVDHLSLANATDEEVQLSMVRNLTIQNSILGETVGEHHVFGGMLINYSHSQRPLDNLSIHHNLWYRITGRLPEISCEMTRNIGSDESAETPSLCGQQPLNLEVSYNLLWDAGGPVTYNDNSGEDSGQPQAGIFALNMNWVGNVMFVGDAYTFGMAGSRLITQPANRLYFSGNHMNLYPDYADLQLVYCCNDFNLYNPNAEAPAATMLGERHNFPPITPTDDVTAYVAANAGAFPRDPLDTRYIASIQRNTIPDVPHDRAVADDAFALVFDAANPPPAPLDSDLDGMPDSWESEHGLDPNTPSNNGTDLSPEGYTNLEVYLNELADRLVGG